MPKKESGDRSTRIAAQVLGGKKPSRSEIETLAGSVLSQNEPRSGPKKKS